MRLWLMRTLVAVCLLGCHFNALGSPPGPSEGGGATQTSTLTLNSFLALQRGTSDENGLTRGLLGLDLFSQSARSSSFFRLFLEGGSSGGEFQADGQFQWRTDFLLFPTPWVSLSMFGTQELRTQGQLNLDLRSVSSSGVSVYREGVGSKSVLDLGVSYEIDDYFHSIAREPYVLAGLSSSLTNTRKAFYISGVLLVRVGTPKEGDTDSSRVELYSSYTRNLSRRWRVHLAGKYERYLHPIETQSVEMWKVYAAVGFTVFSTAPKEVPSAAPRKIEQDGK